ncbi:unnamed protein product [Oikopleura dioica]|uniref:Uncharacterized protein n=1 Tax=Oikopleura dioica TaxID=34765 RepID=E4X4J7_OIKDI|nr:unnamed protein product [Oikopleura dioica]
MGIYFFSERFSFKDDSIAFAPETKKDSDVRGRVADLLFGFPSFKVPETSESFFWWLKGDYFGGEHIVNGEWKVAALKNIAREGEGLDAGPVMLVHKNEKDVIIISPASMSSFNMYQDDWIYAKDNAYSMLMEGAARLKFKSPDVDETCFVEQLDLEFGSSRGARDHIGGAYEEFVKKRTSGENSGEFVPFESMTILVTSNQGPRAAIAKWGEMVQVFGQLGMVDCPCNTFCNKYNNKNIFPQQKKVMFSTSVGSYYDGLVKRAELNGQKQQEMTEELIELGRELVSGASPILVNYFNLGDWWSDNDEYGMKKFLNNRDNIWGPPKQEPPNLETLEGCDRWGTAALYYELHNYFNKDFNMDCEYGFPTSKLETVPLLQDKDICARVVSSVLPEKVHQDNYARNKICWNVEAKGEFTDQRIPCPYREECFYGGITLVNDKNYWSALPAIKFHNTRNSNPEENDRFAGCSQMTIRYSKEVLNQHCRPNLQIGAGEEWINAYV